MAHISGYLHYYFSQIASCMCIFCSYICSINGLPPRQDCHFNSYLLSSWKRIISCNVKSSVMLLSRSLSRFTLLLHARHSQRWICRRPTPSCVSSSFVFTDQTFSIENQSHARLKEKSKSDWKSDFSIKFQSNFNRFSIRKSLFLACHCRTR